MSSQTQLLAGEQYLIITALAVSLASAFLFFDEKGIELFKDTCDMLRKHQFTM